MKQKGKHLQIGSAKRTKSNAKAEDKARSARHRRDKKDSIKREREL
jgi:hypothetical protein